MSKRNNGEGTITKLANDKYMGKIMIGWKADGKPNRKTVYGKTKGEVLKKLNALAYKFNEGTYIEPSKITFGDWILKWLQDYKNIKLKKRTYDTYETQIYTHIIPEIGHIALKDLNHEQIQHFITKKYNGGKGLSSATLRKIYSIINAALKLAQSNDKIIKNPAQNVELPSLEQKKIKAFTLEEQEKFFKTAKGFEIYKALLLDIDTGLRMGELLALDWNQIDFKNGLVSIDKTLTYVRDRDGISGKKFILAVNSPKTKASIRKIPLTQRALKMLKEMKLQKKLNCNLVFPSRNGTYIDPGNFQRSFQTIVKNAGIEICNTHTIRHTFATRCFERGIPLKIISRWLGHSKLSHTIDIYVSVLPNTDMAAIQILETPMQQGFQAQYYNPINNPIITQNP